MKQMKGSHPGMPGVVKGPDAREVANWERKKKGKEKETGASRKERMNREILQAQERIVKVYSRHLTNKDRLKLNDFFTGKSRVGSKEFYALSPNLQELVMKLNLSSLGIMSKWARNPFTKIRLALAKWSLNSLNKEKDKKKKKK